MFLEFTAPAWRQLAGSPAAAAARAVALSPAPVRPIPRGHKVDTARARAVAVNCSQLTAAAAARRGWWRGWAGSQFS